METEPFQVDIPRLVLDILAATVDAEVVDFLFLAAVLVPVGAICPL